MYEMELLKKKKKKDNQEKLPELFMTTTGFISSIRGNFVIKFK